MLYGERKRLADLAAREAAGESFWIDEFEPTVRVKIIQAFRYAVDESESYYAFARDMILFDEGLFYLFKPTYLIAPDLENYLLTCSSEEVPSVIEAMALACNAKHLLPGGSREWVLQSRTPTFEPAVSKILREYRISFDLVTRQMVPFSAKELHQEVVVPAMQLLAGRSDLQNVESAYRAALEEIAGGNAGDAITDAGTALQQMLSSLGCEGNALGPLIASGRSKGLLAPHDSPMAAALEKILHWVSADRSEKGDAHGVSSATIDDAWLTVHVAGALILRLSKAQPRSS